MPVKRKTQPRWSLASVALQDAYLDFILSRKAAHRTLTTLSWYHFTAGRFVTWLEGQVHSPSEITARHVRQYLAGLSGTSWTLNDHARAIRTLLRFWNAEGYCDPISFDMPHVEKKRQPVLTAEQVKRILSVCNVREKAIVMLLVDTGLRRAEAIALNWDDVDIASGLVRILRGKGGKSRSVVIGATTRRALLAYRRRHSELIRSGPLIQTRTGTRFTGPGLLQMFRRISKKAGLHVSPHICRRTFAILSLRAGMDVLHLQALLGHSSLEMVRHYTELLDDDLINAHDRASPIDNLK